MIINNIFDMLSNNTLTNIEINNILKEKDIIIKLNLYKTPTNKIIETILKNNIDSKIRLKITNVINKIYLNKQNILDKKLLNRINNKYTKKYNLSYIDLNNKYIPYSIKHEILVKNIYHKKILISLLNNKELDINTKYFIIDELFNNKLNKIYTNNPIEILDDLKSDIIINYIITNKINTLEIIAKALCFIDNDKIKKDIIDKKINKSNFLYFLSKRYINKKYKDYIYEKFNNKFKNSVNKKNRKEIVNDLLYESFEEKVSEQILKYNKQEIEKQIFLTSVINNNELFFRQLNTELQKELYDTHKIRLLLNILTIPSFDAFNFIVSDNVPENIKDIIYKFNKLKLNYAVNRFDQNSLYFYLRYPKNNKNYEEMMDKILKKRKKIFINKIKDTTPELGILIINKEISNEYTNLIIKKCIRPYNIEEYLNKITKKESLEKIIELNKNIIINKYIKNKIDSDIFYKTNDKLDNNTKEIIIKTCKKELKEMLKNYDKKELTDKLQKYNILTETKTLILETLGLNNKEANILSNFTKKLNINFILENSEKLIELFEKSNIDINYFIQYGLGTDSFNNWINSLIYIIENNKINEFILVKDYVFNNYYDNSNINNNVNIISYFLKLLDNYKKSELLLKDLAYNNIKLTKQDKNTLNNYFKLLNIKNVNDYETLKTKTNEIYNILKKEIIKCDNINTIKDDYFEMLFGNIKKEINKIGGISSLKLLQEQNKESITINILIKELLSCFEIYNIAYRCNDINELKKFLINIIDDKEKIYKIQNIFLNMDNKIKKLYEIEAQTNLTQLEKNKNKYGVLNKELMKKYDGNVYDFSDKNYVLYAHIVSDSENIEDLINGTASAKRNFISVSPISYKGQKYYFDSTNITLAYDKIPNGNYICSSTVNMGSNCFLNSNSYEYKENNANTIIQKGIIETSAVTKQNAETLLFREGLKPCGIILTGGRLPTKEELEIHIKYNLPFIITQNSQTVIENPKNILEKNKIDIDTNDIEIIDEIIKDFSNIITIKKSNKNYTGREIAIITDSHALYEPTLQILEDIKNNGITEIYSLGDNIGSGPNPKEVIDLLEKYNVKSVSGNSEYYMTIGTEPFIYLDADRKDNEEWTYEELGQDRIELLKTYKPSYDITLGNKKIGLCHFINDVRWDYINHSTWSYQDDIKNDLIPYQFDYTNSEEAKQQIEHYRKFKNKKYNGYKDAYKNPIFDGKTIKDYDSIIEGHVHFDSKTKLNNTDIHTLRGLAIGYDYISKNTACYYILKEKTDGTFEKEIKYIPYNKEYLISNIKSSRLPHKDKILSFLK